MKELVLLRHFPTRFNNLGLIMGDCIDAEIMNPSLSDFDERSLNKVNTCDVVYTSPVIRSQKTARLLFHCPIILDKRIRPRGIGDWAGYSLAQIKEVCPNAVISKNGRLFYKLTVSPPNAESIDEVYTRLISFLEDVLESNYQTVGIVVHSMLGYVLFSLSNNTPLETATLDYSIDFYKTYSISLGHSLITKIRNQIR